MGSRHAHERELQGLVRTLQARLERADSGADVDPKQLPAYPSYTVRQKCEVFVRLAEIGVFEPFDAGWATIDPAKEQARLGILRAALGDAQMAAWEAERERYRAGSTPIPSVIDPQTGQPNDDHNRWGRLVVERLLLCGEEEEGSDDE